MNNVIILEASHNLKYGIYFTDV
uniref:GTP-binding protein, putative n=1 Tax=Arundo donax TaxID=35708 RepID=A0A0A9CC90_ARUDO